MKRTRIWSSPTRDHIQRQRLPWFSKMVSTDGLKASVPTIWSGLTLCAWTSAIAFGKLSLGLPPSSEGPHVLFFGWRAFLRQGSPRPLTSNNMLSLSRSRKIRLNVKETLNSMRFGNFIRGITQEKWLLSRLSIPRQVGLLKSGGILKLASGNQKITKMSDGKIYRS